MHCHRNPISVSCTRQVRIQTGAAKNSGQKSYLYTGENTRVPDSVFRAYDYVFRRSDLGPN